MMYCVDRSAVSIRPTAKFLDWLNKVQSRSPDAITLTLEQVKSNCSVFLTQQTESPEEVIAYIDDHFQEIFEVELSSWYIEKTDWPTDMSLQVFWEFFEVEIHDTVLDLEENALELEPIIDNMA